MEKKTISLFKEVVGVSPSMKVIEYLIEWEGFDLTITDIAKGAGIGRKNAYEIIDSLEKKGILKKTRTVGTSRFYILNKKNDITQSFVNLFQNILKHNLNKQ